MNGVFGHREAEFDEFAPNTFSALTRVFGSHLSDQDNKISTQMGTTTLGASLEAPEEPKALAVPAEQGIRLENQKGLFPRLKPTSEKQEGTTIAAGEARFLDLELDAKREVSLAEQGILEQELGLGAGQVQGDAECERGLRQSNPAAVVGFEPAKEAGEKVGEAGEQHTLRVL